MIKQLFLPLAAVAAFIILVGLLVKNSGSIKIPGVTPKTITVGSQMVNVEVARSEPDRERGLGARMSLVDGTGMLFVFDTLKVNPGFWMKGMLIPLDIIWIGDGKIVKIDKNIAAPKAGAPDSDLKIYVAGRPIDYVLEVNGGYSDKNSLKIGDVVDLSSALK